MADTVPEDLEEKQRVSKSMMTNLTHDVDALRDTILRLSDRMEQLKTSSSPAKSDSPNRASAISSPAASLPFVTISIGDPQNHVDSFGSHTSYQVTTKSNLREYEGGPFVVRRRYAEFEWLHQQLHLAYPDIPLLELPPKRVFGKMEADVVAERLAGLRNFLTFLAKHKVLRTCEPVQLFLQAGSVLPSSNEPSTVEAEPYLNIILSDPVRMADAFGEFCAYPVRFESNLPQYKQPPVPIRRRYREFEWLRHQLLLRFPTQRLPALPEKRFFGRFAGDFLEERQEKLQRFVTAVGHNRALMYADVLLLFCTSDLDLSVVDFTVWELPASQRLLSDAAAAASTPEAAAAAAAEAAWYEERQQQRRLAEQQQQQQQQGSTALQIAPGSLAGGTFQTAMQTLAKWWPKALR